MDSLSFSAIPSFMSVDFVCFFFSTNLSLSEVYNLVALNAAFGHRGKTLRNYILGFLTTNILSGNFSSIPM